MAQFRPGGNWLAGRYPGGHSNVRRAVIVVIQNVVDEFALGGGRRKLVHDTLRYISVLPTLSVGKPDEDSGNIGIVSHFNNPR